MGMLRNIKRKFYVSKLEHNENDAKGTWKIIKSISGMVRQSKRVNSLRIEDRITKIHLKWRLSFILIFHLLPINSGDSFLKLTLICLN